MKIVFIVNGYFPNYSTNGICISKIIPHLNNKYDVHVISIQFSHNGPSVVKTSNITIHKVSTKEFNLRNKYNYNIKKSNYVKLNKLRLIIVKTKRFIAAHFSKVNINSNLVKAFSNKLFELNEVALIIPVCFPFEALESATLYKDIYNDVTVTPILFDKFTTSDSVQRGTINKILKFKNHLKRERYIFSKVDHLIATNDWINYIRRYHHNHFKSVNFVEIPSITKIIDTSKNLPSYDFLYSGVLDKKVRPPEKALNIIRHIIEIYPSLKFHFVVKGNATNIVHKYVSKYPENIVNHGSLSLDKAFLKMKSSKILFSIGNIDISQTPSKIFDYMSLNKSIIHFFHDKHDRVIEILSRYPKSLCINLNEDSLIQANKIINFFNNYSTEPVISFEELNKIYPEANPVYTANIINNILKGDDYSVYR